MEQAGELRQWWCSVTSSDIGATPSAAVPLLIISLSLSLFLTCCCTAITTVCSCVGAGVEVEARKSSPMRLSQGRSGDGGEDGVEEHKLLQLQNLGARRKEK